MKTCKTCLKNKEDLDFHKWYKKSGRSGLRSHCRECEHIINKKYRVDNKESLLQKRRIRNHSLPKKKCLDLKKIKQNERIYSFRRRNPDKVRVWTVVGYLIRNKKILKPEFCESCQIKTKVEAHHPDYTKPTFIKWLCKKCHVKLHY
jgi:DNA-directed RNA polymerase beta' subunit